MSNEREQRAARAEQMRKDRERAEKRQRNIVTLGIIAVIVALIVIATVAVNSQQSKREHNTKVIPPAGATKDFGVVYSPKDAGGKPAKDVVRVVIYEDMQCPICQRFEQSNGAWLANEVKNGHIEIEYRFLGFLDDNGASPNQYSHRASNAVLCARAAGGPKPFKTLHDLLYANQPEERTVGPNDNSLVKSAVSVGVKKDAAEACILKHRYVPWINKATAAMVKAKVQGTPTVRINGKDVTGAGGSIPSVIDLQKAIDAAKK